MEEFRKMISFRLPPSLIRELQKRAKKEKVSNTFYLERALTEYLSKH